MSKREKVLEEKRASRRPPVVHGVRRRHRRQCYHPRQPAPTTNHDNNDIFRSVSVPIRDTFAKPATYVVCIASVIKEPYPFLPKECGNKLSRTTFPTVTLPLWLPPLFLFSFHCIAFRSVACFSPPTFYGEYASV